MTHEKRNATVGSTFLGVEDHGIFTFNLELRYGSSSFQGAGNICLGNSKGCHAKTGDLLWEVLRVAGVDRWEKLPGRPVVALIDGGLVRGLESWDGDRSVVFADFLGRATEGADSDDIR